MLAIKGWGERYENHKTRALKKLEFVLVPNKMDGDGYTELLDHEHGAAHLGAWLAILQIASKCEPRGVLMRDEARPHTAETLARMSRIAPEIMGEAITRLLSIGWIESQGHPAQSGVNAPENDGGAPESAGPSILFSSVPVDSDSFSKSLSVDVLNTENSKTFLVSKGNQNVPEPWVLEGWENFNPLWLSPCKVCLARGGLEHFFPATQADLACQQWISLAATGRISADDVPEILAALEAWRASEEWHKDGGRFVPTMFSWLGGSRNGAPNGFRWKDRPRPVETPSAPGIASGGQLSSSPEWGERGWLEFLARLQSPCAVCSDPHEFPSRDVSGGRAQWGYLVSAGLITEASMPEILDGLERFRASVDWHKDGGQYVPSIAVWLGKSKDGKQTGPRWNNRPNKKGEFE